MRQLKRILLNQNESLRRTTSWQFWPEYSSINAATNATCEARKLAQSVAVRNKNVTVLKMITLLIALAFVFALVSYYTEHCGACSDQTQTARVYQNADSSPSKHEDSTQCCFNVGPAPMAVGQYWNSTRSNARVWWAPHRCLSTPTPPPP